MEYNSRVLLYSIFLDFSNINTGKYYTILRMMLVQFVNAMNGTKAVNANLKIKGKEGRIEGGAKY